MKRYLSLFALLAATTLGACSFTFAGQPVTITAADVKTAAVALCGAEPVAEQITAAVDAANKTAASVEAVASILCAGVNKPAAAD